MCCSCVFITDVSHEGKQRDKDKKSPAKNTRYATGGGIIEQIAVGVTSTALSESRRCPSIFYRIFYSSAVPTQACACPGVFPKHVQGQCPHFKSGLRAVVQPAALR